VLEEEEKKGKGQRKESLSGKSRGAGGVTARPKTGKGVSMGNQWKGKAGDCKNRPELAKDTIPKKSSWRCYMQPGSASSVTRGGGLYQDVERSQAQSETKGSKRTGERERSTKIGLACLRGKEDQKKNWALVLHFPEKGERKLPK